MPRPSPHPASQIPALHPHAGSVPGAPEEVGLVPVGALDFSCGAGQLLTRGSPVQLP